MHELLQVTAQYSNAVLVAILPLVSDFAKKLDLPVAPVTANQVTNFRCSPRSDIVGGTIFLTNGYTFSVANHGVVSFASPQSYYSLQDPRRIPEFYGKVKIQQSEAIQIARDAMKKLGYDEAVFNTDKKPLVIPPPKNGEHSIPRYRLKWFDPTDLDTDNPSVTAEFEVDASTKQIQRMMLGFKMIGPPLKVGVEPPVAGKGPQTTYVGGRKVTPVSQSYSNAFLLAILPELNDYIKKAGFEVKLPITTNDLDMQSYSCGFVEGYPRVFIDLKTGDRFYYSHGQVVMFLAHDVVDMHGRERKPDDYFRGPLNMTPDEAISLVRKTVVQLGYSLQALDLEKPPSFYPPKDQGTNSYARYFIRWHKDSRREYLSLQAEVDASTKKLKSLVIKDEANTNIWRDSPKINLITNAALPTANVPSVLSQPDKTRKETKAPLQRLFGDQANIEILKSATSILAYRLAPEDTSDSKKQSSTNAIRGHEIVTGPVKVPSEIGESLKNILTTEQSYVFARTLCLFDPAVALRFIRDKEEVDALLCFNCGEIHVIRGKLHTEPDFSYGEAQFDPAAARLLELARKIFPKDKALQKLKPK